MPKPQQIQTEPQRPNLSLMLEQWRDLIRAENNDKAEILEGRIRSLAASGRYYKKSEAQQALDSLDASIRANEELHRKNETSQRLAAAIAKSQSKEFKQAKAESEKLISLRKTNLFKINTAKLSGKRVIKQFVIPELETHKPDTLIQQAFGGTSVLTDESREGLSDFCQDLVDHLGPEKSRAILSGIREERDRNGDHRTGYIAKREFPLYLDSTDSELQQFGESLVKVYGSKSQGIAKTIEKNLLLETRRTEYLEDTSLE